MILSPVALIASISFTLLKMEWPTRPNDRVPCYVALSSGIAMARWEWSACAAASSQSLARLASPLWNEHRGMLLYNPEALPSDRFEKAVVSFREQHDTVLLSYYKQLAWSWILIAFSALASIAVIWIAMLAADWILAA